MSTATATKTVYFFGGGASEAKDGMRNTLGGKGLNLAIMANLGVPVPPGFTIATSECTNFYENDEALSEALLAQIKDNLAKVETFMGQKFGDVNNPLLFSVRSGARVSMPGMMDTILNLGLNDEAIEGLVKKTGNPRFAWDSYRRFVHMYSTVVLELDHHEFERLIQDKKDQKGVAQDTDLSADDLKELTQEYKAYVAAQGIDFPSDPMEQLTMAISAVFKSWNANRAIKYRKINKIPHDWGTAVNVQTMVFGNMGDTSGTGVCFSRNPSTGENVFYGEYLMNAQGEDVVAGIRTPEPISQLEDQMPEIYAELVGIYQNLEKHFCEMQDMEFTIQEGKLFLLQTRTGKRTAAAAVKIATDMVQEGMINKNEALLRVAPEQIDQLLHPMIDPAATTNVVAKGLPASPGAAVGKLVFTADEAEVRKANGEAVILVREETSPEDIGGMDAAEGILTAKGGMTSHAAVVARGMGKPCVAGCSAIDINEKTKTMTVGQKQYGDGDFITLNGSTGEVIEGQVALIKPELSGEFGELMKWADDVRTLKVRTNAETKHDSQVARDFGAEGIGLCRTEHMFFEGDRIKAVREMILANNEAERRAALAKLLPMQKGDFRDIFTAMEGLPVTVRLLDPPLHEFLPHTDEAQQEMASEMGISLEDVKRKVNQLHEMNPMLGHRGCRLGVTYPEIYEIQAQAIMEAATELTHEGKTVFPEIMVPLVGDKEELAGLKNKIKAICDDINQNAKSAINYTVGTMIEVPRAALLADEVAQDADFFSFGTNDLTQMTYGLSRDDAGRFLPEYVERGIYKEDPFQVLDQNGVGRLIEWAVQKGRETKPGLKIGICGEHGGEPSSVEFCHRAGFDYVSCSPYRVPIARLAAAQAVLKENA
jgi:pyruvate,orthophosphate dikinase